MSVAADQHATFRLPSGQVVHVWKPAVAPIGMVQLQHGFAEYAERFVSEYHRFIPRLLADRYEVWAMDLQGHGSSPGLRAVTDTVAAVRDHTEVRRLMRERGLPLVLFGHSYGGLITAASVADDDADVRGVVLTAPVILSRTPWMVRRAAAAVDRIAPAAAVPGSKNPVPLAHDAAAVGRAGADPLMYRGTTTVRVGATALQVADRLWRRVDDWRVPLVIFHGTSDVSTDPLRSAALVEAIDAPTAEYRSIQGGYHELLHDQVGDDRIRSEILRRFREWTAMP